MFQLHSFMNQLDSICGFHYTTTTTTHNNNNNNMLEWQTEREREREGKDCLGGEVNSSSSEACCLVHAGGGTFVRAKADIPPILALMYN